MEPRWWDGRSTKYDVIRRQGCIALRCMVLPWPLRSHTLPRGPEQRARFGVRTVQERDA